MLWMQDMPADWLNDPPWSLRDSSHVGASARPSRGYVEVRGCARIDGLLRRVPSSCLLLT